MADLRPDGGDVRVGDVVIRTPGLRGDVVAGAPASGVVRAGDALTPLDAALARPDLVQQQHVVLRASGVDATRLTPTVRGGVEMPGVVEVEVPAPTQGWGQFVAVYDANTGMSSWSFAAEDSNPLVTTRGTAGRRRYAIAVTANDAARAGEGVRGPLGVLVHKVIKVVAFRLLASAAGAAAEFFARRWENEHRPHAVWIVPDNEIGDTPPPDPSGRPDWEFLAQGPALLLVHGTFSSIRNGFGQLSPETLARLRANYDNRVFALDHPTLSVDPTKNADWLLTQLPDGLSLTDVDVVCHSRGGLVTRALAGRSGSRLNVRRVVFVASPNSGTVLASAPKMEAFIDTYTNMLTVFPDNPVLNGIDAVIEVVKDVAAGALAGLAGLQSMRPDGPFLISLDGANPGLTGAQLHAIVADYEPVDPGPAAWIIDHVADAAFACENDLVVPTHGAYTTARPCAGFPIVGPEVIPPTEGIHHCSYFGMPLVSSRLLQWLPG